MPTSTFACMHTDAYTYTNVILFCVYICLVLLFVYLLSLFRLCSYLEIIFAKKFRAIKCNNCAEN